jgi:hypothetical protein
MIETQGGDPGDEWFGHNICTVVRASDADFEDGGINLIGRSTDSRGWSAMGTDVQ